MRVPRSVMTLLVQRKARPPLVLLEEPTTTLPSAETPLASEEVPPGRVPRSVMTLLVQRKARSPLVLMEEPTTTLPLAETPLASE